MTWVGDGATGFGGNVEWILDGERGGGRVREVGVVATAREEEVRQRKDSGDGGKVSGNGSTGGEVVGAGSKQNELL